MTTIKQAIGIGIGMALLAGCVDLADESEDAVETSVAEQGLYTSWTDVSSSYGSGIVRACKTSTRVYWQFAYNTYADAVTSGDDISQIVSSIAGVSTGTKYRTRGNSTYFTVALGTNGHYKGAYYTIASLPSC